MPEIRPAHSAALAGRAAVLSLAEEVLASGTDLDVVGTRSSGRSTVLDAIAATLTRSNHAVVRIDGLPSLSGMPLAAAQLAGYGGSAAERRSSPPLQAAIDAIASAFNRVRGVIVVDDADLLDDFSAGAVEAAAHLVGVPVVRALRGPRARTTGRGSYTVELSPLRLDELTAAVSDRLEGPVDPRTMSRLFAESGGVVGVAAALVDAGRREGRLINRDGSWSASGALGSPSLTGFAERLLDGLDAEDRATAEVLALLGTADLETVIALRGAASVGRLEAHGVARIAVVGDRRIATLMPPLLAAHCRTTAPEGVRRLLDGGLGATGGRSALGAEPSTDDQALLVHLVHSRAAEARAAAEARWSRTPDATTAVARITALLADGAGADVVGSAFSDALAVDGDPADCARLAALHARWRVEQGASLDVALSELRRDASALGEFAGIAQAAAVALEVELRGVPDDADERLARSDGLPDEVTAALLEARVHVLVARGRLTDARECLRARDALPLPLDQPLAALHGFLLLGEGRHAEASAHAARGLRAAWSALDAAAIRAHGFVSGLCQVIGGQYAAADESLSRILALGDAGPLDRSDELGILALATLAAARRGDAASGEHRQARITASAGSGSVMGRVASAWSTAQLLAYRGRMAEAARTLTDHAEDMHQDGVELWAVWSLLNAIEVTPDGMLSDLADEWLTGMQSEHLGAHFAFLQARDTGSAEELRAVIPRLQATGRSGLGVVAYRLAAERLRALGETEEAAEVDAEREAFIARLPRRAFDATRFNATAVNLTGREREISRLVAGGLSNPQIASRLVLSVRTVESHLHRIMRKTGTANRGELAAYVRSLAA